MNRPLPFRNCEPIFYSGLLDDPLLLIRNRPSTRNILVDCGQIGHLAKRVLKSIKTLFITHAHMDHFMGIDQFTRSVLVSAHTIDLFGPPGIASKLKHTLQGFSWNLVEDYYCRYRVHEIHPDHEDILLLSGADGFSCRFEKRSSRNDKTVFKNEHVTVKADIGDHKIPVLFFKFIEQPGFMIDEEKIDKLGYIKGPWLKTMKKEFYNRKPEPLIIRIPTQRKTTGLDYLTENFDVLYPAIKMDQKLLSIGYVSDIGFTEENFEKLHSLLKGVTYLLCECTYLREHREKARTSHHLCTTDLNLLIRELRPDYLLPMHLSKTYRGHTERLYEQLEIPPECTLVRLPERITPKPLLPEKIPSIHY